MEDAVQSVYGCFVTEARQVLKTGLEGFFNVTYLTLDREWKAAFRASAKHGIEKALRG